MVAPLLHERDMYLAWSLKRSKAVDGTKRVVGVIGKGHLRGVLYHLTHPEASGGLRCEPDTGWHCGGGGVGSPWQDGVQALQLGMSAICHA